MWPHGVYSDLPIRLSQMSTEEWWKDNWQKNTAVTFIHDKSRVEYFRFEPASSGSESGY